MPLKFNMHYTFSSKPYNKRPDPVGVNDPVGVKDLTLLGMTPLGTIPSYPEKSSLPVR